MIGIYKVENKINKKVYTDVPIYKKSLKKWISL